MIKISQNYAKLLRIFMDQSHHETFGKFLTPSFKFVSLDKDTGLTFTYRVPKHICRHYQGGKGKATFSTSGVMAVFDQLSTYGLMAQDPLRPRGGVSVLLSTEIVKPSFSDDEMTVISKCDKIGKSLGFCTMQLLSADGTVVARGKHIKYLPLGAVWDIITHPVVLPLTIAFHDYTQHSHWFKRIASTFTNIPKANSGGFPECITVGSVYEQLGLIQSNYVLPPDMQISAGSDDSSRTKVFELLMKPHLVNNIGKMHGGAVASVVEEVCYMARGAVGRGGGLVEGGEFVCAIEARYESAMEGDLIVTCTDDASAPLLASGRASVTTGRILNKSNGQVCAEYSCLWTETATCDETAR